MKKSIVSVASIFLSLVTAASFTAGCKPKDDDAQKAKSYLSIDINPSLSLVLDQNDHVMSVIAENEDAQVLLYGESLIGLSAEEAVNKIADLSVELNYLDENNHGINIVVEGEADAAELEATVKNSFNAAVEGKDFSLNFATNGTFSANRELKAINSEYNLNLTVGQYELIVDAQSVDNTLTISAAANMDTEELLNIIQEKKDDIVLYSTTAYEHAKALAAYTYENAKASLIDKIWITPYLNIVKYPKMTGVVYNMYSDSARALAIGLDGIEQITEIKKNSNVSQEALASIAKLLDLSEEEEQQFYNEVQKDGIASLESVEAYLNKYFKNMTEAEREAAKAIFDSVMEEVQMIADNIKNEINESYSDEINKLSAQLNAYIPEELKLLVNDYITEYKQIVGDIQESVQDKEPLPALYSLHKKLEENKTRVYNVMREELEEGGDLQGVEENIQSINTQLNSLETAFKKAITEAEEEAKNYFAQLKQERKSL